MGGATRVGYRATADDVGWSKAAADQPRYRVRLSINVGRPALIVGFAGAVALAVLIAVSGLNPSASGLGRSPRAAARTAPKAVPARRSESVNHRVATVPVSSRAIHKAPATATSTAPPAAPVVVAQPHTTAAAQPVTATSQQPASKPGAPSQVQKANTGGGIEAPSSAAKQPSSQSPGVVSGGG
jgi:hypothetical protein